MLSFSLSPVSRSEYDRLTTSLPLPLYMQSAWLESVATPSAIDYYVVYRSDSPVAVFPIYQPLKGVWITPPNCQTTGIRFFPETDFFDRRKAIALLADRMASVSFARVATDIVEGDLLPFYWKGFSLGVRYNYEMPIPRDAMAIYSSVSAEDIRQKIKKTERHPFTVRTGALSEEGAKILACHYRTKGIASHFLSSLLKAGKEQGFWVELVADASVVAVSFLCTACRRTYFLASAVDFKALKSYPFLYIALLYYTLLEAAKTDATIFDFEGSMLPQIERTFRHMGARPVPYFTIAKGRRTLWQRYRLKRYYLHLQP